jgi:3-deoxy-manno-octulosonate cytidylyltransferase (CMP-KDO synthetase)
MKYYAIIPARYGSTRFPGKPLVDILGQSMISRVYHCAIASNKIEAAWVATDDQRIADHLKQENIPYIMTSTKHQSGTDRCREAAEKLTEIQNEDVVVNIQGDEPFISVNQIDLICSCFDRENTAIASLAKKLNSIEKVLDPNTVKVVFNLNREAIYFSRSPIPYIRGFAQDLWLENRDFHKHLGIYAYRKNSLIEISSLPQSDLEIAESLEQLRWLSNGYSIQLEITDEEALSIDHPSDLEAAIAYLKQNC